jgi:predicted Zn finger-like uncharacterized protein
LGKRFKGTHKSVIVACPSCGARFNLDSAKLLPAGRNVRCAKCDHRWRQMPEGFDEPSAQAETATPAPPPDPESPAPDSPSGPVSDPFAAPPPEEPESHPPRPPETAAEMAQSLAAIAEQVAGARGEGYTVSQAAPGPNPIARLARRTGPGPITVPPRMRPMRPAKRSSHLGLVLAAGFVIGLVVAGYVFRDVIARTVPGADVIYSLFGMSTDAAAANLDISVDDWKLLPKEQSAQKVFNLWGTVFNTSEYPMNIPALMIVPVDGAGSQLEPLKFRLRESMIEPGQNIKFLKSFDNWPPTAVRFEIRVADAE